EASSSSETSKLAKGSPLLVHLEEHQQALGEDVQRGVALDWQFGGLLLAVERDRETPGERRRVRARCLVGLLQSCPATSAPSYEKRLNRSPSAGESRTPGRR